MGAIDVTLGLLKGLTMAEIDEGEWKYKRLFVLAKYYSSISRCY
jgi:hypothetical protein